MTLDLVLDIGSFALKEVRTEPEWLSPKGPQEALPVLPGPVGGALTLYRVLRLMTDIASVPLLPWSSLCTKTGSSLTCTPRWPCVTDESIPLTFPSHPDP